MAITHHQEIVVQYLTADPRIFVSEEYLVEWGTGKGQSIWVDVIAVNLTEEVVYLVEVTTDPAARQIVQKLNKTYSQLLSTVRASLLGGIGLPQNWQIRPWIFIRREAVPKVLNKLEAPVYPKVTYLNTTAWEWEYGKARRRGEEPGKPYEDLDIKYQ